MALVGRPRSRLWDDFNHRDNWSLWGPERESIWRDRFSNDWNDWPVDWPRPREVFDRFRSDNDRWWRDWPSDWPRMDSIMPRFSSNLDRLDSNWRQDPFWRQLYPRWAEPIFKEGLDVKTNIVNDRGRFAVDIDAYQFKPEELQVKTLDDTLLIEGRHEDVRDPDNYTKMYFVRKYQLPSDVQPQDISSSIDGRGHLTVEAHKRQPAIDYRERTIPIAHHSDGRQHIGSRSSSYSPRDRNDSGRGSDGSYHHYRSESRNNNNTKIDPNYLSPQSNGYRNEFSTRTSDQNGLRHSRRSEEFREEMRRTGSQQSILSPPSPLFHRAESRQSVRDAAQQHFNRSASSSRNEFRVDSPREVNILRPSEELAGDTSSQSRSGSRAERYERNVRISHT